MIWKESYNLKHKNGIENYINTQNVLNKILKAWGRRLKKISQNFRMVELNMILPAFKKCMRFPNF